MYYINKYYFNVIEDGKKSRCNDKRNGKMNLHDKINKHVFHMKKKRATKQVRTTVLYEAKLTDITF